MLNHAIAVMKSVVINNLTLKLSVKSYIIVI